MTLTAAQIDAMAELDGRHRAEATRLALEFGNKQAELEERQAREREQLRRQLALPGRGAPPAPRGGPGPVVPGSRGPIALRPAPAVGDGEAG
jgi:hypothetical protein